MNESFVVEHRWARRRLAFVEKGAIDDDDATTGNAQVFLRRGEDEAMCGDVDGTAKYVATHIGDERVGATRSALEFGSQEAVIGAIIDVVGGRAVGNFVVVGDVLEAVFCAVVGVVYLRIEISVAHGIASPVASVDAIDVATGARESRWNCAKLERCAALQE